MFFTHFQINILSQFQLPVYKKINLVDNKFSISNLIETVVAVVTLKDLHTDIQYKRKQ